jgi:hypothetical protein
MAKAEDSFCKNNLLPPANLLGGVIFITSGRACHVEIIFTESIS